MLARQSQNRCAVKKADGIFYQLCEGIVSINVLGSVKWPLFHCNNSDMQRKCARKIYQRQSAFSAFGAGQNAGCAVLGTRPRKAWRGLCSEDSGRHKLVALRLHVTRVSESFHDFPEPRVRAVHEIPENPPVPDAGRHGIPPVQIFERPWILQKTKHRLATPFIRHHQHHAPLGITRQSPWTGL